jgi:hypothetical protein
MVTSVFISFRPENSAWAARIRNRLKGRASPNDLGRGVDFANALKTRAGEVEAVVLIIGRDWLAVVRNDPCDPTRIETETALSNKIHVIPVLVDSASMPLVGSLPESLKVLAHLQPIELSSGHFDSGIERLEETLDDLAFDYLTAVSRTSGRKKTARKSAATKKAVRKGAAKTAAAGKATRLKVALESALMMLRHFEVAGLTAEHASAAKKAGRPTPGERNTAGGPPRIAVNQGLSVHEMRHLAWACAADASPNADRPRVRSETVQPADAVEDKVECSVFGPPAAPPGKAILIQVFLHLADQAKSASLLKATKSLDLPIRRGARVEIAFSANGLVVDDPVQSLVWRGEPAYCQFLAAMPAGPSGQSFFPVVRVSVDGKLVGPIKFRLSSEDTASQPASEPLGDHAGPYRYAFVSYASKDRDEVLKRVQMLEILKTKFFQDILSLDLGDRWEKKPYQNIDRCDLFLLFWSQAAKDSQWVMKEAEYALAHQQKNSGGEPDLVPVVLEQNVLPPPTLSAFHFNDRISYLVSLMPKA